MSSLDEGTVPPAKKGKSPFGAFLHKLRKRRILETLAAFIGGGWLLVEVVERLLVSHYDLPERLIDISVVSVVGALLATLAWRWFRSAEKQRGNLRVEILLVPLLILATAAVDLAILLKIFAISGKTLLVAAVAVGLGIAWIILKSLKWAAAATPQPPGPFATSEEPKSPISGTPEKSIVVLPFADLSPQKDQEYFCDGMTEEIITDLSHVRDLLVISRSSAMTFRRSPKTLRDIAKDLNVRYVMEGSVRKAGNDLRITAQLIDATNDAHVWAQKYSGNLDDVFDIQEKVSRSIVDALKVMLTSEESVRMSERPIGNVTAYECFLKAKHDIWSFTREGTERAIQYLHNALDILGDNASIYAGLGIAHFQLVNMGVEQEDHLDKARDYVQKSFALEPGSPQAHAARGYIYYLEADMPLAISHLKEAASRNPSDADTWIWLSFFCLLMGKGAAAARYAERGLRVDPINPLWRWSGGILPFFEGRFDLAAEQLRNGYEKSPDTPMFRFWYALSLAYAKKFDESRSVLDIGSEPSASDDAFMKLSRALRATLRGEDDALSRLLTPETVESFRRDPQSAYHLASYFALLNKSKDALDWLEIAVGHGIRPYPLMVADPFLASIRNEPRFQQLMERVKHEWEHFEV